MNLACIIITGVGIIATVYSIVVSFKYDGLKRKLVQTGSGLQQSGSGSQQTADQTTGDVSGTVIRIERLNLTYND